MVARISRKYGEKIGLHYASYLVGLFHDIGKNCDIFHVYITQGQDKHIQRGSIDHCAAGGRYVYNEVLESTSFEEKNFLAELLATTIFSHHGLRDMVDYEGVDKFKQRLNKKLEYINEAIENSKYIINEGLVGCFEKAMAEVMEKYENYETFEVYALERMLLSILIDADRTDTARFMGNLEYNKERKQKKIKLIWESIARNIEKRVQGFDMLSAINIKRARVSKRCYEFSVNPTGIYTLQLPTGAGKTIAGFRFAINHSIIHNKERIFYVAPFKMILEQTADVIRSICGEKNDELILEHHSDIIFDNGEEKSNYDFYTDSWNNPIILTTFVQMMNTWFGHKMQSVRRLKSLSNSVIIFDEIQAMPLNMISVFYEMANVLSEKYNVTILLCSATQPPLSRFGEKLNISGEIIEDVETVFKEFKRTNACDCTCDGKKYSYSELAEFAVEKLNNTSSGLIVVNTKKAAENVFRNIKDLEIEKLEVVYLTTNMCPQHRLDKLEYIKKNLEKNKIICVGTNLIEAGVDISFGFAIRDIAGLDAIVQTGGRCNRKGAVIEDLIGRNILRYDEMGLLSGKTKIFSISQLDAFVRFIVYIDKKNVPVWKDIEMYNSYINYYLVNKQNIDLCYVTGEKIPCSEKHPAKIRHAGDKSKLISSNDTSGFLYRGRFDKGNEAYSIGFDVSQKAHSALRWLIARQGTNIGEMAFAIWSVDNKQLPDIKKCTTEMLLENQKLSLETYKNPGLENINKRLDRNTANRVIEAIFSRRYDNLSVKDRIVYISVEAATTGRLSITGYEELNGSDFLNNIIN